MVNDKRLTQIIAGIPLIISKALMVVFMALYFEQKKGKINQEPQVNIIDFWGGEGWICHIPYWVALRYSFVRNNYHYILRPERIPENIPTLVHKAVCDPYHYYERDYYYGRRFDLPEYLTFPYSGPDTPFSPAKVDSEQLLKEEEINVKKEWCLKVA